jgi:hypothetical protein
MKPGIYDLLPASVYHADPLDTPSLSASLAVMICQQSPRHAWAAHPRLNPDYVEEQKEAFDLGTVVHELLLEGHMESLAVVDAPDWRTNGAKAAREAAYVEGKTPLLAKHLPRVTAMVDAVIPQLAAHDAYPAPFTVGKPERTLVWETDGVACRARLDWLHDDYLFIDDLKTVGRSAEPQAFSRSLFGLGYHIKAAFYARGVRALSGVTPEFRIVAVETSPPYAISVVGLAPAAVELGEACVEHALRLWGECLAANDWPGYSRRVHYAEPPAWLEAPEDHVVVLDEAPW